MAVRLLALSAGFPLPPGRFLVLIALLSVFFEYVSVATGHLSQRTIELDEYIRHQNIWLATIK
jgi:hypothetical protein